MSTNQKGYRITKVQLCKAPSWEDSIFLGLQYTVQDSAYLNLPMKDVIHSLKKEQMGGKDE